MVLWEPRWSEGARLPSRGWRVQLISQGTLTPPPPPLPPLGQDYWHSRPFEGDYCSCLYAHERGKARIDRLGGIENEDALLLGRTFLRKSRGRRRKKKNVRGGERSSEPCDFHTECHESNDDIELFQRTPQRSRNRQVVRFPRPVIDIRSALPIQHYRNSITEALPSAKRTWDAPRRQQCALRLLQTPVDKWLLSKGRERTNTVMLLFMVLPTKLPNFVQIYLLQVRFASQRCCFRCDVDVLSVVIVDLRLFLS